MRFLKLIIFLGVVGILGMINSQSATALEKATQSQEARIEQIVEEKEIEVMGTGQLYQKLELVITKGLNKGQNVVVENGDQPLANIIKYEIGDKVVLASSENPDGSQIYIITDFVRRDGLILLTIIFVIVIIGVAKWKGLRSIVSMMFTFLIIFWMVLPKISSGSNPVVVAAVASMVIIPISFYMAHGLSKKTSVAILGSLLALIITSVLAYMFINLGHLTGLSSEEAGMLSLEKEGLINMKGLLLAGIVIGALGVLDDITISQAAIVDELSKAAKLNRTELYFRAMNIGKDHITSMVNTLVLAYAGASLPLLLIFINNPHPFGDILNYEMIAEEIIRTLIGSIGLVAAVPLTTLIAAWWYQRK